MSQKQVGGPPGDNSTVDWCLYQLNGAAEFEVSEGECGVLWLDPMATTMSRHPWVAGRLEAGRGTTWQPAGMALGGGDAARAGGDRSGAAGGLRAPASCKRPCWLSSSGRCWGLSLMA